MKIIIKKGAPSLRNHLNRGGTFGDYRHQFTNYDHACAVSRAKFGFGSEQYKAMVAEFAAECVAGLSNDAHKAKVAEWLGSKEV